MSTPADQSNGATPVRVGRRRFLQGAAAAGVALGAASLWSWHRLSDHQQHWVEAVIRDNLPGVALDERTLQLFIKDVLAGDLLDSFMRRASIATARVAPWVTAHVPPIREKMDRLERQVLTEFLIGSNFFLVTDARRETIEYYGPAIASVNPFARKA